MEIIFAIAIGAFLYHIATKRGAAEPARPQESPAAFTERAQEQRPQENRYAVFGAPGGSKVMAREQVKGRQITTPGAITQMRPYGDGGLSSRIFGAKQIRW